MSSSGGDAASSAAPRDPWEEQERRAEAARAGQSSESSSVTLSALLPSPYQASTGTLPILDEREFALRDLLAVAGPDDDADDAAPSPRATEQQHHQRAGAGTAAADDDAVPAVRARNANDATPTDEPTFLVRLTLSELRGLYTIRREAAERRAARRRAEAEAIARAQAEAEAAALAKAAEAAAAAASPAPAAADGATTPGRRGRHAHGHHHHHAHHGQQRQHQRDDTADQFASDELDDDADDDDDDDDATGLDDTTLRSGWSGTRASWPNNASSSHSRVPRGPYSSVPRHVSPLEHGFLGHDCQHMHETSPPERFVQLGSPLPSPTAIVRHNRAPFSTFATEQRGNGAHLHWVASLRSSREAKTPPFYS